MEINILSACLGLTSPNPAVLSVAIDRLHKEHQHFRERIQLLSSNARKVNLMKDQAEGLQILKQLRRSAVQLMTELDRHSEWEDQELYPFLKAYFHLGSAPSILPSFWVIEKDHLLGVSFIKSFIESVKGLTLLSTRQELTETASHLLQACLILMDHFTMDEQLILPLSEKVFTDLESFFS